MSNKMKTKFILIGLLFTSVLAAQGFRQNAAMSLFSDQKANRIGDAITIIIVEASTASNNAETTTGRSSNMGLEGSLATGGKSSSSVTGGVKTNNDFSGSGTTKTTGMIQTKLSATIDSVYENGNLRIKGSRRIVINDEEQTITIRGIVRTSDISASNTVYSTNISEAEIIFAGDGAINSSQKPGLFAKLIKWLF
jgi:flagellar L-ring protein precursor FlgH